MRCARLHFVMLLINIMFSVFSIFYRSPSRHMRYVFICHSTLKPIGWQSKCFEKFKNFFSIFFDFSNSFFFEFSNFWTFQQRDICSWMPQGVCQGAFLYGVSHLQLDGAHGLSLRFSCRCCRSCWWCCCCCSCCGSCCAWFLARLALAIHIHIYTCVCVSQQL